MRGKRVLVRVDFNVPVDPQSGLVTDASRIQEALPTLTALLEQGAQVIAMSHRGRPVGPDPTLSLEVVLPIVRSFLPYPVSFVNDIVSTSAHEAAVALKPGEMLLLQNLRFDPGEEANSHEFAGKLASLADVYVDDAFGTAHRMNASIVGVPAYLPSYAGKLMEKEVDALNRIVSHPRRPYWAVMGGAKVSDKLPLLEPLLDAVDGLVVGGELASCFMAAQGYSLGRSPLSEPNIALAAKILAKANALGVPLIVPIDLVLALEFHNGAAFRIASAADVQPGEFAVDIGPQSLQEIRAVLAGAKTVVWNGPMGVFEWNNCAQGTLGLAAFLADSDASVIIGGGDTVAAVYKAGVSDRIADLSTGGGATLQYLAGKDLPGLEVLAK